MKEFEFINWIRGQSEFDPSVVAVGPGDDCAVINVGGEKLLVTTDQVLDGVHFSVTRHGPAAAGRKAAARNLSDIAAMAGLPLAMVATVAAPEGFSQADGEAVYEGLRSAGDEFDCPLVGGDVAAWADQTGQLQISVTVFATAAGIEPVLRSGASPGQAICVTGALGAAWRGRRHLSFTPRVAEARALARDYGVAAMIDISDGLAADLNHILTASGVAADLDAAAIPIHAEAAEAEADDPLALALFDGEDYELLFTLPAAQAERLIADNPLKVPVVRIGTIVAGEGMTLLRAGKPEPLPPGGWEHRT